MHRFFCLSGNISTDKIIINDKGQVHHFRDVLRLKANDEVLVFDEERNEYACNVEKINNIIVLNIKAKHKFCIKEDKVKITVACAIPKKAKFDDIVDKLTQLGVQKIIPLETERVIIKLDKAKERARQERWRNIALGAACQSQRNSLPVIEAVTKIEEVLMDLDNYDLKLIPALSGKRKPLKDIIAESNPKNIIIFIGPEGDFTQAELDLAKKSGCVPVSLGDLVLRVDTAAIAVASFIRFYENH
jgi:16S rRNA (uracil1498-N3)-methyltransferase